MARLTFKAATAQLKEMGFNLHRMHGQGVSRIPYMIGRTVDGEVQTLGCVSLDHAVSQAQSIKRNEEKRRRSALEMSLLMSMK